MSPIQIDLLLKVREDLAGIKRAQAELDTLAKKTTAIQNLAADISPLNPAALIQAAALAADIKNLEAEIQSLERQAQIAGAGAPQKQRAITTAPDACDDAHDGTQLTAAEGISAGIYDAANQLGATGENLASLFSGALLDSVNAITDGIYGWITGTESFGDVLRNLGDNLFKELLNTIIRIGAQWLINTILVKTGLISINTTQDTLRTQQTSKTIAAQSATLPGATANAAATGISSWGLALVFGALAIALILAAAGAFATGGPVNGRKQLAWLNDGTDGPEYVIRGAARAKYGDDLLASINTGSYSPAAELSAAGDSLRPTSNATDALAAAMPAPAPAQVETNPIVFFDRDALLDYMLASGRFNDRVTEVQGGNRYRYS